jgi:cytochrome c biogenesis protein CcdA
MDLVFAYGAGLLTLINPCVLPVLPIVLATALQASRFGPLALAAGMSLSFVALGLLITAAGRSLGLDEERLAQAGAVVMIGFGLVLLVPAAGRGFALATGGFSARADTSIVALDRQGAGGQFLGGALLGAVWSPCIGPTLGGAIALASQGQGLGQAGAIMAAFAAGVSTIILALAHGARSLLSRNRALMHRLAGAARPTLGAVFVAVGLAILFRLHLMAEAWLVETLPPWLVDFSVSL